MTTNRSTGLLLRLLAVYVAALFGGSLFIFFNNIVINNKSFNQLLAFNIPFVLLSCLAIAILLLGISYWRLRPVFQYYRHALPQADKEAVFHRLMQFPFALFKGMLLISLLFIFLYHAAEMFWRHHPIKTTKGFYTLLESMVMELSLAFILSFLLLSASRRLLRAYAVQLDMKTISGDKRHSTVHFIAMSTFICFVIVFAPIQRLVVRTLPEHFRLEEFFLVGFVYAAFAVGIFSVYIREIRQELRMIIDRLYALSAGMSTGLHKTIPIITLDETGRLTAALNMLQHRIESRYAEVEQQLKLAYSVQNRLLPRAFPLVDGLEIAVSCQQCQAVGGDFYDLIPLGKQRYCVAIGDVAGSGLPAALLMAAMMTGLRTEAAKGGDAGDILTRLNRHVHQMTQGKQYATMGLALIDLSAGSLDLDYASAGHLDPYLIRNGQVMEWQFSSLPLGMTPDGRYAGAHHPLLPGDLFVLYTDGIIESGRVSGEMLGFEWWEQQLRQLPPGQNLAELLAGVMEKFHILDTEGLDDDRTLLLMQWTGTDAGGKECGQSVESACC